MAYDYTGDMSYFQQQLTAKGISRQQLDMNDFIGLTRDELQSIVDNPKPFMKPSADSKIDFLKSIDTTIPEGFTKDRYVYSIHWMSFSNQLDSPSEINVFDFICKFDIDEVVAMIRNVEREYHDQDTGSRSWGRFAFWDDRLHSDRQFNGFSHIAEELVPSDVFHEERFQKMLLEAYEKYYG